MGVEGGIVCYSTSEEGGIKKLYRRPDCVAVRVCWRQSRPLGDSWQGWKEGDVTVHRKVDELQSRQRQLSLGVQGGPWKVTSKARVWVPELPGTAL